jgi:ethanolaminephosphotransferase
MYTAHINRDNLRSFKYKFLNVSICYHGFISNWVDKVIGLVPRWVAPNLLTLCSFTFVFSAVLFVALAEWSTEGKSLVMAVALFLYQLFDNLDGKQARRTGNATPLGMLFDHGLDSVNNFLLPIGFMHLIQVTHYDPKIILLNLIHIGVTAFYFAQWCFYHTGVLVQTEINPVDEGLITMQIICLVSAVYGDAFWNAEVGGCEVRTLFICLANLGSLL